MANMSYCRFENTAGDLADCKEALQELLNGECGPLSNYELLAAKQLVKLCRDILVLMANGESVNEDFDLGHLEGAGFNGEIEGALNEAQAEAKGQNEDETDEEEAD